MSYSFPCNLQSIFTPNPSQPQRVGYLTDFNGLGLSAALAKDLTVYCPYNNPTAPAYTPIGVPVSGKVNVVAVLENFSWNGGTSDPLSFNCCISRQNFNLLWTLQQMTLKTTSISTLGCGSRTSTWKGSSGSRRSTPSLPRSQADS